MEKLRADLFSSRSHWRGAITSLWKGED